MLLEGLGALRDKDYGKAIQCFESDTEYKSLSVFFVLYCKIYKSEIKDVFDYLEEYQKSFYEALVFVRCVDDDELRDHLIDVVMQRYVDSYRDMIESLAFMFTDVSKSYMPYAKDKDEEIDALYFNTRTFFETNIVKLRDYAYQAGEKIKEQFGNRCKQYIGGIWILAVFADAYGGKDLSKGDRDIYSQKIREYSPKFDFPEYLKFSVEIDALRKEEKKEDKKEEVVYVVEEPVVSPEHLDLGEITGGVLSGIRIKLPKFAQKWSDSTKLGIVIFLSSSFIISCIFLLVMIIRKLMYFVQTGGLS